MKEIEIKKIALLNFLSAQFLRITGALISFFLLFLLSSFSLAAPSCLSVFSKNNAPRAPQIALELEFSTIPEVIQLLTTTDGTIQPLLKGNYGDKPTPPFFIDYCRDNNLGNPRDAIIDHIDPHIKLRLFRELLPRPSSSEYHRVRTNRTIPALKVKRQHYFTFAVSTEFLGVIFEPGRHLISIAHIFEEKVEWRSSEDIANFTGVELHMRRRVKPSQSLSDSWDLLSRLGLAEKAPIHMHIVAPLNKESLSQNPEIVASQMTFAVQASNILVEYLFLVYRGLDFKMRLDQSTNSMLFDFMRGFKLGTTYKYLTTKAKDEPFYEDVESLRMAMAGFRAMTTYTPQNTFWGIEFREGLRKNPTENPAVGFVLDGIQSMMLNQRWPVSFEETKGWIDFEGGNSADLASSHSAAWYNSDKAQGNGLRLNNFDTESSMQLRMLLYDWINHPLVYGTLSSSERDHLIVVQQEAIRILQTGRTNDDFSNELFRRGRKNTIVAVEYFMRNSGLIRSVLSRMGLDVATFNRLLGLN